MWKKLRKILGILTDLLLVGRQKGWWKVRQQFPEGGRRGDQEEGLKES